MYIPIYDLKIIECLVKIKIPFIMGLEFWVRKELFKNQTEPELLVMERLTTNFKIPGFNSQSHEIDTRICELQIRPI